MQFDKLDHKIKEAAEQHHPSYDETAWAKMEKLLDREMPQKKDRRRVLPFLLTFLLLAGGAGVLITQPWKAGSGNTSSGHFSKPAEQTGLAKEATVPTDDKAQSLPASADNSNAATQPATIPADNNSTSAQSGTTVTDAITEAKLVPDGGTAATPNKTANPPVARISKTVNSGKAIAGARDRKDVVKQDQFDLAAVQAGKRKRQVEKAYVAHGKDEAISKDQLLTADNSQQTPLTTAPSPSSGNNTALPAVTPAVANGDEKKNSAPVVAAPVVQEPKAAVNPAAKKKSGWAFIASIGPDLSYVSLDKPGKTKLVGGLGVAYSIRRWALRTGFYTTNKVYSASKEQYKPSTPIMGYNYLTAINANCKVYEIPVGVAYQLNKHFFVAGSVSTLIMKKEVYKYVYTYPNNPNPYTYTRTVDNQNKHYFSVLTLSAGYQRRLSKTISLAVEPYVKLPLSGVGYGKVKLNSVGALFSVIATPF